MSPSPEIPFEGVLNCWNDEHDLPDLLLAVRHAKKTGRLLFSNPDGDKTLHIKAGNIVFAESSSQDDGLGQHLLRSAKISLMDYTRVSKLMEPGKRLGTLLVEQGVLSAEDLVPAIASQVREIILRLFRRTETWYGFKEGELSRKETVSLDMPFPGLILDGLQYVESWRRISKGVGNLDSVFRCIESSEAEWGPLQLEADVRELFEMLKEPVSLAHICTHATLPDFDACRYLWGFRCLGWIEQVDATQTKPKSSAAVVDPPPPPPAPRPVPQELIETRLSVSAPTPREEAATKAEKGPKPETAPKPRPIPQKLIETQLSVSPPPEKPEEPASPPAPAAEDTAPAKPRSVPQELVETRIAVERPKAPPAAKPKPPVEDRAQTRLDVTAPAPSAAPNPRPQAPATLAQTQLAVDTPSNDARKDNATTQPSAGDTPRAKLDELAHTQIFEEPPPPPSTGEMMEAILEGEAATPPPPPESSPGPAGSETRFFEGPSALDAQTSSASPETDESPSPPPATPAEITRPSIPKPAERETVMASFEDVSFSDDAMPSTASDEVLDPAPPPEPFVPEEPEPVPTVEASAVRVVDAAQAPTVETEKAPEEPPSPPKAPAGMEAFASSDPFGPQESPSGSTQRPATVPTVSPARVPTKEDEELDNVDRDGIGDALGTRGS